MTIGRLPVNCNCKERRRSVFACTICGNESAKWMGFCPSPACGSVLPLVFSARSFGDELHNPLTPERVPGKVNYLQAYQLGHTGGYLRKQVVRKI